MLGLSFRVRNGTGRLPQAMTAANLLFCRSLFEGERGFLAVWGPDGGRVFRVRSPVAVRAIAAGRVRSRVDAAALP